MICLNVKGPDLILWYGGLHGPSRIGTQRRRGSFFFSSAPPPQTQTSVCSNMEAQGPVRRHGGGGVSTSLPGSSLERRQKLGSVSCRVASGIHSVFWHSSGVWVWYGNALAGILIINVGVDKASVVLFIVWLVTFHEAHARVDLTRHMGAWQECLYVDVFPEM